MKKKIVKEATPILSPQGASTTDSNWSRLSNKKSMKGKDIQDLLGIRDEQGPVSIQKPGSLSMMDIVDSFYEPELDENGQEVEEEYHEPSHLIPEDSDDDNEQEEEDEN